MVSVPIYPTANADTVAYILGHSEAKAVFIGKLDEPDALGKAIPDSLATIAFPYPSASGRSAWNDLIAAAEPIVSPYEPSPGDVMTILYTSGSTGRPKGVVISYGAYHYGCSAAQSVADLGPDSRLLSYLPLAHVTERAVIVGPSIYAGARIFFVESLHTFPRDLKFASPTIFGSVPRLWVKFQSGIHARIPPRKLRVLLAIPVVGRLVARKIRAGMGWENCQAFGSGTAPISLHTLEWYRRLGVNISEGWGMTETSGLSCTNLPFRANRLGTIGVPLDGTELKISDEGELLIRSPGLFTEYYKQPELTAEAFTEVGRILPYRRQGRVGRTPRGLPHHRAGQGHFQIGKRQVRRARPDRESPVGEPLDRTGLRRWLGPAGADRARCPVGCGTASAQGNCRGEPRENPPGNQPASRVA